MNQIWSNFLIVKKPSYYYWLNNTDKYALDKQIEKMFIKMFPRFGIVSTIIVFDNLFMDNYYIYLKNKSICTSPASHCDDAIYREIIKLLWWSIDELSLISDIEIFMNKLKCNIPNKKLLNAEIIIKS